tara:strand:- start:259 stop:624 length:366 start_codon:yes stop_codon:yes gene_type:complete
MWRIWNKLFGWHYVAIQYLAHIGGEKNCVQRVTRLPTGELTGRAGYYNFFIDEQGELRSDTKVFRWVPLTWERKDVSGKSVTHVGYNSEKNFLSWLSESYTLQDDPRTPDNPGKEDKDATT